MASLFDTDSPYWQACVEALAALRDRFLELQIPFVVAVLPGFDSPVDDDYPYRAHHDQIRETLARLGIASMDLRSLYEGVEVRRLVVTPFTDAHPNELAHRIAADYLADRVRVCLVVEIDGDGVKRREWRCGEDG